MTRRIVLALLVFACPIAAQAQGTAKQIIGYATANLPTTCVLDSVVYDLTVKAFKRCSTASPAAYTAIVSGATGADPTGDDYTIVADSTTAASWKLLPDCDTAATSKLLYDQATNAFSCGTDQAGSGLSGLTTNHVLYATSATAATTESGNEFYWDPTNNRLGILDGSPTASLTVGSGDLFTVSSAGAVSTASTITSTYSTGGNALVIDTSTLVADATNNRVGVGDASPDAVFDVEAGSLGNDIKASTITATAGGTPTTHLNGFGMDLQLTGAGGNGWNEAGFNVELLAGYSSTAASLAARFIDWTANTNTSWTAGYSSAFVAQSRGSGGGYRFGGRYFGLTGTGRLFGTTAYAEGSGTHAIGVVGAAASASTATVGGWFTLAGNTEPTWTSSALVADNAAVAAPIFLAKDNGTTKVTIADGGAVTLDAGLTLATAGGLTISDTTAAGTCSSAAATTCTMTVRSGCKPTCSQTTSTSAYLTSAAVSGTTLTCTWPTSGTNTCNCICW